MVLGGASMVYFSLLRSYTLVVDDKPIEIRTIAFTPRGLVRQVGYELVEEDNVWPSAERFGVFLPQSIRLDRSRPVTIFTPDETITFNSTEVIPANLLAMKGITLFPEDMVLINGAEIDPTLPLGKGEAVVLQFVPARRISLNVNGQERVLFTQARTLAEALEEKGITLQPRDVLSAPADTWLTEGSAFALRQARTVTLRTGETTISFESAAESVAGALRDGGLPPQNLDYTLPAEDQPIPEDGQVTLVRVVEEIMLAKEETAYTNSYQEDPNAELDTVSVLVPGQLGYVVTRTRARLEDGVEVSSLTEGPWKASDPVDGVLGRGSKVVIRTEVVDGETIEYWRKITVYATSYHPAEFSYGDQTRSGLALTKGIIAVSSAWYGVMAFQPVFVPGYGRAIVADSGGGMPDRYWIDLGYDDANYVGWHDWTTLYFLTPVPAYIPLVLP